LSSHHQLLHFQQLHYSTSGPSIWVIMLAAEPSKWSSCHRYLIHSMMKNIAGSANTLPKFLQTLTHSIQIYLFFSIVDADASNDEWISVFNYLRQTKFTNLSSLVWFSNQILSRSFEFLSLNINLPQLDFSGCFSES
jgi:hypothetical protein